MRIAWVLYGSLEQRTGGTIYDAEVVRGLASAGDDVQVVSLDEGATGEQLARRLRGSAADVVVGDELCFRQLGPAYRALGGGARRVLLVHHLTAWETELAPEVRRKALAEEREAIDASERIVATSQTTRARLLAECAPRAGIDVVLPGADRLALAVATREGTGEVRFAFVGSIVPRKRALELVRAFAGGAHENGRLTLVGSTARDVAYVAEVREAIARLGLGARVEMSGEVDEAGVSQALADAEVLVMPSSLEGYGIAATEAIRAGVPVIATRAQGLEEALAPCPDATMFADDEPALAAALARFADDASLRAGMTAAARAASPRMPTWSACAAQFRAALAGA
jgi:glycosyltransferase involved in cell wall biosynthesis